MAVTLELFRVDIRRNPQSPPPEEQNSETVLKAVMAESRSVTLVDGEIWQTGDIEHINDGVVFFRIGRTTIIDSAKFDAGHFEDVQIPETHYTEATLVYESGLLTIAQNQAVARTATKIAKKFGELVESVDDALLGFTVKIRPVLDPSTFISQLLEAEHIRAIRFSIKPANHFKNELEGAAQLALMELNAKEVTAAITGDDLNAEQTAEFAKSVIEDGGNVTARIIPAQSIEPKTIYVGNNKVKVLANDFGTKDLAAEEQPNVQSRFVEVTQQTGVNQEE